MPRSNPITTQSLHRDLAARFAAQRLHRPQTIERYETGDELTYEVTGVVPAVGASVRLVVEKFIGGGYAGQVYRASVLDIQPPQQAPAGLAVGTTVAIKILLPPAASSRTFRDALYRVGFQGPFQLQVNPAALRAGAMWHEFITRAAAGRFGTRQATASVYATFTDHTLGSGGELLEWIDGRTWRFEVDDHLDELRQWRNGKPTNPASLGSPEYRAKRQFMADFVSMLHEMGAHEFARQYEWSTCKSQPNVLKRTACDNDPAAGLTAVDFRAGLTLLPFLPMSPGDVKLIAKGIARGSLVQFDRGNLKTLRAYIVAHPQHFAGMDGALAELEQCERIYRDSVPDVTHNHVRLLYSGQLWSTMLDSAVTGWRVDNAVDDAAAGILRRRRFLTLPFALTGMIGLLATAGALGAGVWAAMHECLTWPLAGALAAGACGGVIAGRPIRKVLGRGDYRRHYMALLNPAYFLRALRGKSIESLLHWSRSGRVSEETARRLATHPLRFFGHCFLRPLPGGLHRCLTDWTFYRERLLGLFARPFQLYFRPAAREQWLRDMLAAGRKSGTLSNEDSQLIESQLAEPFIQKYLKCLAVHICLAPTTHVVALVVAVWYALANHLPLGEAFAKGLVIIGIFQVIPVSPGSLARGFYVLYLGIRERDFKDYNIAVFLAFFKYIGYLAFPIQMAYHYPALARFMAGHWATGAVHVVPVFGEKGALLEHAVFNGFYNWPLTIRRRTRAAKAHRETLPKRTWHVPAIVAASLALFAAVDCFCLQALGRRPDYAKAMLVWLGVAMMGGSLVVRYAGGHTFPRRLLYAVLCGALVGLGYSAILLFGQPILDGQLADSKVLGLFAQTASQKAFVFALMAVHGVIIAELKAKEPKPAKA
ncbi:MAG: hypothetical protein WCK05_01320 [Planctomycetota bacterium]